MRAACRLTCPRRTSPVLFGSNQDSYLPISCITLLFGAESLRFSASLPRTQCSFPMPVEDILFDFLSTMPGKTSIITLSNDLLRDILDHIEADPERTIPIDRRDYLSVESFRPVSAPPPPQAQDIGNFRLVCRRFADLGVPHQFTRIATRFSPSGLQRLDRICSRPHLARHTRKFSYLIPDFYVDGWR